jgi:hypothetical protein
VTQAVQAEIVTGSLPAGGVSTSAQGTLPITEGEVSWFAQLLAMMQAHAGVDAPVPAEVRIDAPLEGEKAPTPAEMAQMANWLSLPVLWTPPLCQRYPQTLGKPLNLRGFVRIPWQTSLFAWNESSRARACPYQRPLRLWLRPLTSWSAKRKPLQGDYLW